MTTTTTEAYLALRDLSEDDRITVATTELAGVLFEHDGDPATLAAFIAAIRNHHDRLAAAWASQSAESDRIASAARAAHGTPLKVVKPDDERGE